MTLESLTDILAAIGAAACLWWAAMLARRLLGGIGEHPATLRHEAAGGRPLPIPPPAKAEEAVPADHVAAIAAAVAACGYRVVHIEAGGASAWVSEGRWIHQTSHRTH